MSKGSNKLVFDILIDESFSTINTDSSLRPVKNKMVLSIINDFEDGSWRYKKFQSFIWDNIAETALSYQERESLLNHSLLTAAAQNLRLTDKNDKIGNGSELAEIVLYGIMKYHYNALPVVPKIFYKQNAQDNAKGADSVHIVLEDNGDFSIWFGEAKFYNSIDDSRLDTIIQSVENSLKTNKLKKENSIITNVADIDYLINDVSLVENIKKALSPSNSIDNLKPKLHIPILLLHECKTTQNTTSLTPKYKNQILGFHKERAQAYFSEQISKISNSIHRYSEVKFHIILFPVPDKKNIVNKFLKTVKFYKD